MICPKCGKEISDSSKFCQFCGSSDYAMGKWRSGFQRQWIMLQAGTDRYHFQEICPEIQWFFVKLIRSAAGAI
jgi:hypothetical protein